jgi:ParB family chromosome partitioning protein
MVVDQIRDISLSDLVVGKGQVRVSDVGKDISELANSIRKQGLLEPIVVTTSNTPGKYEILAGQRRFLAHQELNLPTIRCIVRERSSDPDFAKVVSLTENLVRRDPSTKDLIDACTTLYRRYVSIAMVAEDTGLPPSKIREYVKYDQLAPGLKKLVDESSVNLKTALRAQRAAEASGVDDPQEIIELAKGMSPMSGVQQERVIKKSQDAPHTSATDIINAAHTTEKVTQIVVTLSATVHSRLKMYADEEQTTQDDAAASLIEQGLESRGINAQGLNE